WCLYRLGVFASEADSPLLRSGSVINLGLLFGAMMAALLAGQFGVRVGPRSELVKGAVGGVLLGTGAVIARGCNVGGFFSATSAFGLNGLAMAVGLAVGAFVAARYLVWEAERGGPVTTAPAPAASTHSAAQRRFPQPLVGAIVFLALLGAAIAYGFSGFADRAIILLFGVLLGVISQRSRVCFVQAFREPFLTGRTEHTRAMLLGLLVSVIGFALVKTVIFEKELEFVRPTFWAGSLIGGLIFGVGMVLAGGCGGGTIWRVGEGHVKLWLALITYVFSASLVNELLQRTGLRDRLGEAVFLPDLVGWNWAVLILVGVILLWYVLVRWNEATGKLAAM
ncbi:MAG: YeeE/YedE thiosulfate transporter family protein, partial [Chloroflexota bacterium]